MENEIWQRFISNYRAALEEFRLAVFVSPFLRKPLLSYFLYTKPGWIAANGEDCAWPREIWGIRKTIGLIHHK